MQIEALGDRALLLRFGEGIDDGVNARVLSLAARIDANRPSWLRDCVPAYASLAIFIDETESLPVAETWLKRLIESTSATARDSGAGRSVEIPVRYCGTEGPDLDALSDELGIAPEDLIARHCAPIYRVAMLGFAPGFPYLLGLDPKQLAMVGQRRPVVLQRLEALQVAEVLADIG